MSRGPSRLPAPLPYGRPSGRRAGASFARRIPVAPLLTQRNEYPDVLRRAPSPPLFLHRHRQASMTELYPLTPSGPSRRSTLRAAGGGALLLGLGLAGCRSAVSDTSSAPQGASAALRRGGVLNVAVNA